MSAQPQSAPYGGRNILDTALSLAAAGISVLPIKGQDKRPAVNEWKSLQAERADEAMIREWFGGQHGYGLGVICGAVSGGLEMTEVEGRADDQMPHVEAAMNAAGLAELWRRLCGGWVESSPSRGTHWLYRLEGTVPGNERIAKAGRDVLAETRGEGGYVVVAPTDGRFHQTGRPWTHIVGGPGQMETLTQGERAAFHSVLRAVLHKAPPAPERPTAHRGASAPVTEGALSPGDDYEKRTGWADILEPHGWRFLYTDLARTSYWRRPGKSTGISATTGRAEDRDRLYVFSTSTDFDSEVPITKFHAYAVLEHGGDHHRAAAELRRQGYGQSSEPLRHEAFTSAEGPLPLDTAPAVGWFPADALPAEWGRYVVAQAEATQTPLDLPGVVTLGVMAACIGGKVAVQPRPGWQEPTNLYTVVAMPPGSRKSAVFADATRPLRELQQELVTVAAPEIAEARARADILADKAAKLKKDAVMKRGVEAQAAEAEYLEAVREGAEVEIPAPPRLIADDATPEALASLAAAQGGRMAVAAAEAGIIDILFGGRYTNGHASTEVLLRGHAGDAITIDRKGRDPEHIESLTLTLVLTVQPAVLKQMSTIRDNGGSRGELERFLYALPESNMGKRSTRSTPVPRSVSAGYQFTVSRLARLAYELPENRVLTFAEDAQEVFDQFADEVEPELGEGGIFEDESVIGWGAKLTGAVARMAAVHHMAGGGSVNEGIGVESVEAAISLGHYFVTHAQAVFHLMGAADPYADERYIVGVLRRRGWREFSTAELHRVVSRPSYPKASDVQEVVNSLVQLGWLHPVPEAENPQPKGRGRPASPRYTAHDDIFNA